MLHHEIIVTPHNKFAKLCHHVMQQLLHSDLRDVTQCVRVFFYHTVYIAYLLCCEHFNLIMRYILSINVTHYSHDVIM